MRLEKPLYRERRWSLFRKTAAETKCTRAENQQTGTRFWSDKCKKPRSLAAFLSEFFWAGSEGAVGRGEKLVLFHHPLRYRAF